MKPILTLLPALLLASQAVAHAADELVVYPPVPGLAASEHYQVRVRSASDGSQWQSAFAWKTVCKTIEKKTDGYFDTLAGWTHTYVNFETAGAVEIEIACVNGHPWLKTPNLDGLAGGGIDFQQFNVHNPVCSPNP